MMAHPPKSPLWYEPHRTLTHPHAPTHNASLSAQWTRWRHLLGRRPTSDSRPSAENGGMGKRAAWTWAMTDKMKEAVGHGPIMTPRPKALGNKAPSPRKEQTPALAPPGRGAAEGGSYICPPASSCEACIPPFLPCCQEPVAPGRTQLLPFAAQAGTMGRATVPIRVASSHRLLSGRTDVPAKAVQEPKKKQKKP
ncbi:hypothetical protein CDD81_3191 [Ophiocordyceps australis]|uniref:Uncharacterized protein n=1 Tax=Ophiocordyceps australis TaxID=1399860 RepID=A0A2C5XXT2_9HYPO|nr:hypothetical protein CDD81_3191 [Ophiocordyceps australis]